MTGARGVDPGLALILSEEERNEYSKLDYKDREVWLRRFWKRSDPTPTTEVNEWEQEYRRRVLVARTRFGSGNSPGWDSRGEIYIRFGEPDYRLVAPGYVESNKGLVAPEETWTYTRYGLVFRFEDRTLDGEYVFAFDPRDESRARYQPWDEGSPSDEARGFQAMDVIDRLYTQGQLAQMEEDGLKAIEFTPLEYRHDYGGGEIDGWMEIAAFLEADGTFRVEVNRELDRTRIADAFELEEELMIVNRVAVYDSLYELSSLLAREDVFEPGGKSPAVFSDTIKLVGGEYWIAASSRVSAPPMVAIFDDEVRLKRAEFDEFRLSDLSIRSLSFRGDGSTRFVPRPSRIFVEGETAVLVFEVYGVGDARVGGRYRVEYALSPVVEAGGFLETLFDIEETTPEVVVSYTRHTSVWSVREEVLLDTSDLEHDNYRLVVTVTDIAEDKTQARQAGLRVVRRD
jgi:GWxTD domain-containing protein